jgi:hypothetical protein
MKRLIRGKVVEITADQNKKLNAKIAKQRAKKQKRWDEIRISRM